MISDLKNSLFIKQPQKYEHLNELSQQFATVYCGRTIVKDNIFAIIENYVRIPNLIQLFSIKTAYSLS